MSNEIQVRNVRDEITSASGETYCSMSGGSIKEKAIIFNAMNNPAHKVGDFINQTIRVKDILAEYIEVVNEETGEQEYAPRVVLIDVDGNAYQAVSKGVYSSIAKLSTVFGAPTWEEGLPLKVKQVTTGKFKTTILEVDEAVL